MGCDDGVVSVTTTAVGSLQHTLQGAENQEAQVSDEALLPGSAPPNRRLWSRDDEFLSVVKPRCTSRRAASLDFLEYVLPFEGITQLGCKGKSFWKNLRFWQRINKGPPASDLSGGGRTLTRPKREVLGPPLYTDGINFPHSGSKRSHSQHQQQPYGVIDPQALYMYGRSDDNMCAYVPLNRCPRIPSGPLYLP